MQGINWDILRPVDIGGAFNKGFERGQEMRTEAVVRKSLQDYANGADVKATQMR